MCKDCNYVALHNHSHYSLLDGYATIDEYIQAAKDNGMIGIGLADHGTASGLYKFITRVKKAGLIPVPGLEFYVAPENPEGAKRKAPVYYGRGGQRAPKYDVPGNGAYLHLTVFAYNNKGLENLFKLTSMSWEQEHFYLQPRIDTNMLAEHSEGLIVTTGCPSSEVNRRFLLGQDDKAYEYASRLKSIFGENMYVEIMDHKMEDDELERILMPKLIKLSRDLDIPMIATNDSHYAFKHDAAPHERVLSIQTKTPMTVPAFHEGGTRFAFSGPEYYIKSYDEMYEVYPEDVAREALENTIKLTKKCEEITLEYDPHLRPEIEIPEGMTSPEYLQVLIAEGFNKKRGHESDEVKQESIRRIREEFAVLHSNDFIDYFLVVHDYIDYAHRNNIGVGAGRGCFLPGSKVKSTKGSYRNIEDIKPGEKVQTHDTTYQVVEDTFIYDVVDEDMVKIKLSNGREINATADHLIFHKDRGFIKAEDFVVGDIMLSVSDKETESKYNLSNEKTRGVFISYKQGKKEIPFVTNDERLALSILETQTEVKEFTHDFKVTLANGDTIQTSAVDVIRNANGQHNDIEVISIEKYKYTGKVYDLQVANVHNYTLEGVTVHNSVGGSEIAYVLDISNTDPIKYDLLFERFLSPGRGSQYQIDYADGTSQVMSVSEKREVYYQDGSSKVVYIHELEPGDLINYKGGKEVIKNIFVKVPGSAPDVDTDFHTEGREEVIEYCVNKYGHENVANIVTFGTFKAKRAFKAMCTAYRVPFALANKASDAIPNPEEGVDVTLAELVDPTSARYNEGADFRQLTEGDQWNEIIEMAIPLNGRISETGVHPCGIIISNQPLAGIIPTQVRQADNKLVTQWEYPELEALGLIKMDFLGLELINTIQQTVENIELTNESVADKYKREVPNMREIVLGEMDDPATYKNLQEGHTIGVFQLGSPGVRELLRRAKPTQFMDIATITALYRPGPMSTNAHLEWADRKNGVKEVEYIDPGFKGTVVQEILEDTSGILVFQEQLMQIVTRYAGMSSYEADTLRKAMGKKKMDIMMSLKPKFVEGAIENGSTKQLAEKLWDTMEGFAQYGFNKSHSVSYAINIYQTIYLKTHYPSEFMAALIQQGFGNPSKVAEFLQEAQRMGLRVGPVDINGSQVKMAATGKGNDDKYDIVYGFAGVKQVNETLSQEIVNERVANGLYKSVADFVKRITKRTQINSGALSSLALAGAFDGFGVSRKLVSEKARMIIDSGTRKAAKGVSLFDLGGIAKENDVTEAIEIHGEDYSYNEKIKLEADRIGLFVSGHPTENLGHIALRHKATPLSKVKQNTTRETFTVLGTVTQLATKVNRSGRRSIAIMIDDGSDTAATYLPKHIVQAIEKGEELERIRKAHAEGKQLRQTKRSEQLMELVNDDSIEPMESIVLNDVYKFTVQMRGYGSNAKVSVQSIERLETAFDGSLPYEVRVVNEAAVDLIAKVAKKHEDKNGAYILMRHLDGTSEYVDTRVKLDINFIMDIEKVVGTNNIITDNI